MTYYIFIGPKKTGTSSVYGHLKKKINLGNFFLLPKESNILLEKVYSPSLIKENVIDISPEYFSSFRAMFNAYRISQSKNIKIIVLKRGSETKFESYLKYMVKKREVSGSNLSIEFEKLFLQDEYDYFVKKWIKLGLCVYQFELGSGAFTNFLENEFKVFGNLERENDGQFDTTVFFSMLKVIAKILRKLGLKQFVEFVASLSITRKFAYKRKEVETKDWSHFEIKVLEMRKLLLGRSKK